MDFSQHTCLVNSEEGSSMFHIQTALKFLVSLSRIFRLYIMIMTSLQYSFH